jgi:hypothetical protein
MRLGRPTSSSALTIYAPMIYTAPCVIVLMWRWKLRVFGPLEIARADRRVPFGAKKLEISSVNPPPPPPHIMYLPASKQLRAGPYKS